jgi:hypothetical protein
MNSFGKKFYKIGSMKFRPKSSTKIEIRPIFLTKIPAKNIPTENLFMYCIHIHM